MATNNFKAFALDPNANVLSQADWEALPALLSGFTSGKASSAQVNKAIRQATTIAALVGQFIANSGSDALDDGDVAGLLAKFSTAVSGRYSTVKKFGSSGTYTWPSDVKFIEIIATGGGGGGGGCNATTTSQTYFGAGGGAGGTVFDFVRATDVGYGPGTYPVTVGLGGTGGVGAVKGNDGGTTQFMKVTAYGGKGGGNEAPDSTPGGAGGLTLGGYMAMAGGYGQDGQSTTRSISGNGGGSYWSGGGRSANLNPPSSRGGVGDGGGGAYDMLFRGVNGIGANGSNGVVIIREFR